MELAAKGWSYPQVECTSLQIHVAELASIRVSEEDGVNLIVFRAQHWCHNERCSSKTTFPIRAMGMTATYPEGARGGDVREGDIELNSVHFNFSVREEVVPTGNKPQVSLHAVLTHELGHVIGLSDACGKSYAHRPPDPSQCSVRSLESVMYAPALHEKLSEMDVLQLCRLYPKQETSTSRGATGPAAVSDEPTLAAVWWVVVLAVATVGVYRVFFNKNKNGP